VHVQHVASGQKIVTIEGLGTTENLSLLQKAFVEHTAFGCGFCTPGMIVAATALLAHNPNPSREEIIEAMDNNLCRCGSYPNVIAAVLAVANSSKPSP
jgi:aerobic-type carbon monoxide dehydrogenase small subunit (CoxS/CutS family)